MTVVYWSLVGVFSLTALLWLLSLLQLVARARDMEFRITAQRRPDAPTRGELVSVIVPARNEEGSIGGCLDAVLAQTYEDLEVIVVDDRSEDGTAGQVEARAADDDRVVLVPGEERPEGWAGKVWACHTGQQRAQGRVLLFIDADVRLTPEALRQARAYLRENEIGAVSVFGRLTMLSFWEWVVQPVIGGLILQNNDPRDVNDADKPDKVMANGQFIMVTREGYDELGGHESIKREILDDVGFARRCKTTGVRYHMVYGRELYGCRMYDSLSAIWEGWTKNLFAGLDYRLGTTLVICVLLFVMNVLPFLLAPAALAWFGAQGNWSDPLMWLLVGNIVLMYVSYIGGLRTADYPATWFWTYPLGMLVTIGIFVNSAVRIASGRGVSWKGRTYVDTGERQNRTDEVEVNAGRSS